MKLRARQEQFRDNCIAALNERGNTLGVAPTGAGKSVCLSAIGGYYMEKGAKGLIIQHRDELVDQNRRTFGLVNRGIRSGLYTADEKSWAAPATFAMIQTLGREANLQGMPKLDFIAIDEGHHAAAPTYRRTLDKAMKDNPDCKILLVTATPNRGDGKALKGVVDNVADQITLKELIDARLLVRPRTFVVDIGVQDALRGVPKRGNEFDDKAVEAIMDKDVHHDRIIEEWAKLAGDRQTVVFCSTVDHAEHVAAAFRSAGVRAGCIFGDMGSAERAATLAAYDRGDLQVITNVAVLTEGWDHQPTSCVILLRLSSYQSTMLQMVGRGLRTVDPERYPGVVKDDCIVLDFGTSILMHGSLEQDVKIDGRTKACPECEAIIPASSKECMLCGHVFPAEATESEPSLPGVDDDSKQKSVLTNFVMTEIDLLNDSPFRYENLFDGLVSMANAFDAWVAVISFYGRWHAVGGGNDVGVHHLADSGDRLVAMAAADDFMRINGDTDGARKTKRWLSEPCSDKQRAYLQLDPLEAMGVTKYAAACRMTWMFNERVIRRILEGSMRRAA